MKFFYLCSSPGLDNQSIVHDRDCPHISLRDNREYLGPFNSASEAGRFASLTKENVKVCASCGCGYEVYTIKSGHIRPEVVAV